MDDARRQAQEYADQARLEREQAEQTIRLEAKTSNQANNEAKKDSILEEARIEKKKGEAQDEAKQQRQEPVAKDYLQKNQDDATSTSIPSEESDTEQKETLDSSASLAEEANNLSTEKRDDDLGVPLTSEQALESIAPFGSPVAASTVRLASSNLGRVALPVAAILGGAVSLRNNRIKRELEMHVELRELSKERIGELAQEEKNRINVSYNSGLCDVVLHGCFVSFFKHLVSKILFWASIVSAVGIAALQL